MQCSYMDMTRVVVAGLAGIGLCLTSCEKIVNVEPDPVPEEPIQLRLPLHRLLTDKEGRSIDATITERGPDFIKFIRRSDGKDFDYPLSRLSEKDLLFIKDLPLTITKPMPKPTPSYIANRLKEMEELKLRLEVVENDLNRTLSEIKEGGLKGERDRLKQRILSLERQIETYKRQNPQN